MKATSTPKNVNEYIAAFPPDVRAALKAVRATIRKALPGAEEAISYGMPTYKKDGRYVIYFAGWKKHFSLYPVTSGLAAAFKDELAPYELSGKGTVRFPLSGRVPVKLIAAIAKFRARESAAKIGVRASHANGARRRSGARESV